MQRATKKHSFIYDTYLRIGSQCFARHTTSELIRNMPSHQQRILDPLHDCRVAYILFHVYVTVCLCMLVVANPFLLLAFLGEDVVIDSDHMSMHSFLRYPKDPDPSLEED